MPSEHEFSLVGFIEVLPCALRPIWGGCIIRGKSSTDVFGGDSKRISLVSKEVDSITEFSLVIANKSQIYAL